MRPNGLHVLVAMAARPGAGVYLFLQPYKTNEGPIATSRTQETVRGPYTLKPLPNVIVRGPCV